MEWLVIGAFCAALLACVIFNVSILFALVLGFFLFVGYGIRKGSTITELLRVALDGVKTVKNILITFILIGLLTAFWRAAGTIPVIVCYASALISPSVILLMTFLLNALVSILTGTAFGTGATMGVICATMASTMGISPILVGGAVLSGVYVGDRCSPVSTSAMLVAALTKTDIYNNIKRMCVSAGVPFLVSCAVYTILGFTSAASGELPDLNALFDGEFVLHWSALLPAILILTLSVLRVNVKTSMTASILSAVMLCVLLQHIPVQQLGNMAFFGYHAKDVSLSCMINGGGIKSMIKVCGIVLISSSYSGIFQKTGLLDSSQKGIKLISEKLTPYAAMLFTACVAGMVACNQTLTIMLTDQLCGSIKKDPSDFANALEDTSVVVAPLIPWSIASGVPLTAIGSPVSAILVACYLYLIPVWRLICSFRSKRKLNI